MMNPNEPFAPDRERGAHGIPLSFSDKRRYRLKLVDMALAWCEAAVADGWTARPTYEHEPIEQAWTLEREGYKAMGISRLGSDKMLPSVGIHVWGPDRLAIDPPLKYDWLTIVYNEHKCSACARLGQSTNRVGFAGRYCDDCTDDARAAIETPGWAE